MIQGDKVKKNRFTLHTMALPSKVKLVALKLFTTFFQTTGGLRPLTPMAAGFIFIGENCIKNVFMHILVDIVALRISPFIKDKMIEDLCHVFNLKPHTIQKMLGQGNRIKGSSCHF